MGSNQLDFEVLSLYVAKTQLDSLLDSPPHQVQLCFLLIFMSLPRGPRWGACGSLCSLVAVRIVLIFQLDPLPLRSPTTYFSCFCSAPLLNPVSDPCFPFPSEEKALLPHRGSTDAGDSRRDWWCSNALLHGYRTETNIVNQRRRIFCMTPRNMPMIDHLLLNRSAWDASCESVRRITSQPDQAGSECLRTMFNHQKGYPQAPNGRRQRNVQMYPYSTR